MTEQERDAILLALSQKQQKLMEYSNLAKDPIERALYKKQAVDIGYEKSAIRLATIKNTKPITA